MHRTGVARLPLHYGKAPRKQKIEKKAFMKYAKSISLITEKVHGKIWE